MHLKLYLCFFLVAWSVDLSVGISCLQCNTMELPLEQHRKVDRPGKKSETEHLQDCIYGNFKPTPCDDSTDNKEPDTCDKEIINAQAKLNLTAVYDEGTEVHQCGTIVAQNKKHRVGVIRFCTHEHLNVLYLCKKVEAHPLITGVLICDTCDKDGCNNADLSNSKRINDYAAVSLMRIEARKSGVLCRCGDKYNATTTSAADVQFPNARSSLLPMISISLCIFILCKFYRKPL